ncbi:MAG: oxidoreductase [Phycisphaeraceae bacterium]|nr:MAG: oxidoreductase [Phycisphaeraceae bacterium]
MSGQGRAELGDGGGPLDRRAFMVRTAGGLAAMSLVPSVALGRSAGMNLEGVRVAVIGAGRQGRDILGELARIPGASVSAVCDVNERRLASSLRRAAGAKGYASIDDLMGASGEFDAVIVATPTPTHRAIGERAIASGKHVYLECPLAHTVEDCAALASAARSSGAVVAAGLHGRANPVYTLARGFFLSDSVRDTVSLRAQNNRKTSWQMPVRGGDDDKLVNWRLNPEVSTGLAGEWGTQQYDVFNWYRGSYPTSVTGWGSTRLHQDGREIPDTIMTVLEWDDGVVLEYSATLANSYGSKYEVFHGTNAAIKLSWTHGWMFKEADAPTQGWEVYANRQQFHNEEGITLIAGATQLAEQGKLKEGVGLPNSSLWYALDDWVASIGDGSAPATSVDEAARATAVGIAAHRAVMSGERTKIDLSAVS